MSRSEQAPFRSFCDFCAFCGSLLQSPCIFVFFRASLWPNSSYFDCGYAAPDACVVNTVSVSIGKSVSNKGLCNRLNLVN